MNKAVIILIILILNMFTALNVKAEQFYIANGIINEIKDSLYFRKSVRECKPVISIFLDERFEVIEKQENLCKVKMGDYDCMFPITVIENHTNTNSKHYKRKFKEYILNDKISLSQKEENYFHNMRNKYCIIRKEIQNKSNEQGYADL